MDIQDTEPEHLPVASDVDVAAAAVAAAAAAMAAPAPPLMLEPERVAPVQPQQDQDMTGAKEDDDSSSTTSSSSSWTSSEADEGDGDVDEMEDEDDDVGATNKAPPKTRNEVAPKAEVEDLPEPIRPDQQLDMIGTVLNRMDEKTVIVKGEIGVAVRDDGSVLCLEGRHPLGRIGDIFGPITTPFYVVQLFATHPVPPGLLAPGVAVYAVRDLSKTIVPAVDPKGSDASNAHDEEISDSEREFSDDEAELAYRKQRRQQREAANGGEAGAGKGRKPRGPRPVAPAPATGGAAASSDGNSATAAAPAAPMSYSYGVAPANTAAYTAPPVSRYTYGYGSQWPVAAAAAAAAAAGTTPGPQYGAYPQMPAMARPPMYGSTPYGAPMMPQYPPMPAYGPWGAARPPTVFFGQGQPQAATPATSGSVAPAYAPGAPIGVAPPRPPTGSRPGY